MVAATVAVVATAAAVMMTATAAAVAIVAATEPSRSSAFLLHDRRLKVPLCQGMLRYIQPVWLCELLITCACALDGRSLKAASSFAEGR